MDGMRKCPACGEVLTQPEFRPGALRCRACEMVACFSMARRFAAVDEARAGQGLRPMGMKMKPANFLRSTGC